MNETSGQDIRALLAGLRGRFESAGIDDPAADAELIVGHVLQEPRGRVQALAILDRALSPEQAAQVERIALARAERIPLQHLTGRAPFRGIELSVGPGVFVPRPETETVAQFAIDALRAVPKPEPVAVDLCTGSGAIALAIADEVVHARVLAVEKSTEAHAWAKRNTAALGEERVELLLGDIGDLDPASSDRDLESDVALAFSGLDGNVDVLVSNPPYVPEDMVPRDPEVRDHDPALALYSGADGLDLVRVISRIGARFVVPGGAIVLEHAELQGAAIRRILERDGWLAAATHPDLTGRDRTTTAVAAE